MEKLDSTGLEIPFKLNEYQAFSRPSHSFLDNDNEESGFHLDQGKVKNIG